MPGRGPLRSGDPRARTLAGEACSCLISGLLRKRPPVRGIDAGRRLAPGTRHLKSNDPWAMRLLREAYFYLASGL